MMTTRMRRTVLTCVLGAGLAAILGAGETRAADDPPQPAKAKVCPAWAVEQIRPDMWLFQGKYGLVDDPFPKTIAPNTAGIDYWQANHFIVCRKETRDYLYREYTPTCVHYVKGTLPTFEAVVERHTRGLSSEREKAVALLQKAMPDVCRHPALAPLSPACEQNRGIADDEELLKSGKAWCNEQSRVFVRLCQVAGIPARMIFLFYTEHPYPDRRSGHVVAEFYADGRWSLADNTWLCVFPAADGHLMSALECHQKENRGIVGKIYYDRNQVIVAMPPEEMVGKRYAHLTDPVARREAIAKAVEGQKQEFGTKTAEVLGQQLDEFGVLNYPLPTAGHETNTDAHRETPGQVSEVKQARQ